MWIGYGAVLLIPGTKVITINLGGAIFERVRVGEDIPEGALVSMGDDGLAYRATLNGENHGHVLGLAIGNSRIVRGELA
jgi:hypothetical protein